MNKSVISLIIDLKHSCMAKEEKIIEELQLSPAEYRGLLSAVPGSAIQCKLLSRKMGLSISRGSRVIDKLINNGYLRDQKDNDDQRVTNVILTSKGVKIQQKIHSLLEDCEHAILKNLSGSEVESLTKSLTKISEILVTE